MVFAKLHPLLVHFPIGLLVSGTLLEIIGNFQKEETTRVAGWFNIRLGFWCAIPVMAVGFLGADSLQADKKLQYFLNAHIFYAFSTVALFALVLIIYRFLGKAWVNVLYNFLLAAGLCLALTTGYFGGEMVHRYGVEALHLSD